MTIISNADNRNPEQTLAEFPGGSLPLGSPFYIERPPVEQLVGQEICKPGSVIRIKAPKQMGKSSLLLRLLHQAKQFNCRTVRLDFRQIDNNIFSSLDWFLRWFCANLSRQLELTPLIEEYWDEEIGSKVSCTIYLQGYLLEQIDTPIVLVLNEINLLFEHPQIAREFMGLLRSWYEEARQQESFQKLRLVLVHSTEVYINFNINQSPFNVGLPVCLREFTLEETIHLAGAYGLDWTDESEAKKLMAVVGGQPYLIGMALYHLVTSSVSLDEILEKAHDIAGIYSSYLRERLVLLQEHPELATALKKVVRAEGGVKLDPLLAYKLEQMGLVKLEGDSITLSCNLYRKFCTVYDFGARSLPDTIKKLKSEIHTLKQVGKLDETTNFLKGSQLEFSLKNLLAELDSQSSSLSFILCEIDFFNFYTKRKQQSLSEKTLRKIAGAIRKSVFGVEHLVARYSWAQFAIVLPGLGEKSALQVAKKIHLEVKKLAIPYNLEDIGGLHSLVITVSLGLTSLNPNPETSFEGLIEVASEALHQAKIEGRNRTKSISMFEV
ncbi:AAA-like domain-containing protein [Oscillatoria sp. FACHB-1406]|uniref:AAA-like domain-containing protein n=1 Tax=Oscillatoria sp. FACHB-1406 TaxID=2692846 RepID=UPI001686B60E|nr:AAA-like domain-containing protein [Oscillatoria sp. FACHB-1406]MBD2580067.1 AAA-like domain-containing protein [Oscillatoria sp. FACHB-1406]